MRALRQLWDGDRGRLAELAVATALGVYLVVETALSGASPRWAAVLLAVAASAAILLTRRAPFAAPLAAIGCIAAMASVDDVTIEGSNGAFLVVLFCCWSLGANNGDLRAAVVGLVAAEALIAWINVSFEGTEADYFWVGLFAAIAWATGLVVSRRSQHARELGARAAELERGRAEAAERAVAHERQRIARELHDVVAHSVSVMTVQAGAVRRLLLPEQQRERQALETVEATGREALTEMRRLVGLLREQGSTVEFAPQPSMRAVDILVGTVREAGLPVELSVEGEPRELPPGVDLSAYRVIQEALTNALKYAGPAQAWVTVRWRDDGLELEIANDGRSEPGGDGRGHGLEGMRERVSLVGGSIESGPRNGGGFVVKARLPIGAG